MPLARIELIAGKSAEYKRAIMDGVHRALVNAFAIPEGDRLQRLYELDKSCFDLSDNKTEDFVLVELTVFKGRSAEAKRKLYRAITDNLSDSPGIRPSDVLIVIHEPPLENWGVAGGKPASEVDLGFDINV